MLTAPMLCANDMHVASFPTVLHGLPELRSLCAVDRNMVLVLIAIAATTSCMPFLEWFFLPCVGVLIAVHVHLLHLHPRLTASS